MTDNMDYYAIVTKLIGPVEPVGSSHIDEQRLKNLNELTDLAGKLLDDIRKISRRAISHEYSVRIAGELCKQFIDREGL